MGDGGEGASSVVSLALTPADATTASGAGGAGGSRGLSHGGSVDYTYTVAEARRVGGLSNSPKQQQQRTSISSSNVSRSTTSNSNYDELAPGRVDIEARAVTSPLYPSGITATGSAAVPITTLTPASPESSSHHTHLHSRGNRNSSTAAAEEEIRRIRSATHSKDIEEWQVFPDDIYALSGNKYTKEELAARTPWGQFVQHPVALALLFCSFGYVRLKLMILFA
jgi:hypothetical protein